jgi:hypothetical protein
MNLVPVAGSLWTRRRKVRFTEPLAAGSRWRTVPASPRRSLAGRRSGPRIVRRPDAYGLVDKFILESQAGKREVL